MIQMRSPARVFEKRKKPRLKCIKPPVHFLAVLRTLQENYAYLLDDYAWQWMIVDGRYEDPVIRKVDGRRKRRKSG